jgi:serine/threonine protein kinase
VQSWGLSYFCLSPFWRKSMALSLYRYNVEDAPFARGGMGDIYKAIDLLSQETVIIKTINALRLNLDEKTIRTFFKEAEASFRLGRLSDHIIKVTDIGCESGTHYMVQEYATGGNLFSRLGKVSGEKAKAIIDNILRGLKIAHENKIIHSDISPDNILYDEKTSIYKLADFGLLKIMESHLVSKGMSIHRGGKPHYMPSAHYFDPDLINQKTDFYSIGIVYYQLLTGEIPKPDFPNPPVVSLPVVIKAEKLNLHNSGVKFIEDCLHEKFENVDELITAFAQVSPYGEGPAHGLNPKPGVTPRFEVTMLGPDEYEFLLLTVEGEVVFSGQKYRSRAHAKAVINSVRKSAVLRDRYARKHVMNEHFFVLNSAKNEPLGRSRSFRTAEEMDKKIDWMMINTPLAVIAYTDKTVLIN